jgi:hypothetical protein
LDEVASAVDDRRRKAREVTDDTAAKRNNVITSLDAQFEQAIHNRLKSCPTLALFTCRNKQRHKIDAAEIFLEPVASRGPDILVTHDQQSIVSCEWLEQRCCSVDQPMLDEDIVTALA